MAATARDCRDWFSVRDCVGWLSARVERCTREGDAAAATALGRVEELHILECAWSCDGCDLFMDHRAVCYHNELHTIVDTALDVVLRILDAESVCTRDSLLAVAIGKRLVTPITPHVAAFALAAHALRNTPTGVRARSEAFGVDEFLLHMREDNCCGWLTRGLCLALLFHCSTVALQRTQEACVVHCTACSRCPLRDWICVAVPMDASMFTATQNHAMIRALRLCEEVPSYTHPLSYANMLVCTDMPVSMRFASRVLRQHVCGEERCWWWSTLCDHLLVLQLRCEERGLGCMMLNDMRLLSMQLWHAGRFVELVKLCAHGVIACQMVRSYACREELPAYTESDIAHALSASEAGCGGAQPVLCRASVDDRSNRLRARTYAMHVSWISASKKTWQAAITVPLPRWTPATHVALYRHCSELDRATRALIRVYWQQRRQSILHALPCEMLFHLFHCMTLVFCAHRL